MFPLTLLRFFFRGGFSFVTNAFLFFLRCHIQGTRHSERDPSDKEEDHYIYSLAGVVVHMGTANSGHYYSYIRPRDGGGEWLEFNDTVVTAFDVKVCLFLLRSELAAT